VAGSLQLDRAPGRGLAIVQRIITEHHGTIAFDSHLHHGTRCTLTFPLNGNVRKN